MTQPPLDGQVFDEDYRYSYAPGLDERPDAEVDLLSRVLELAPGTEVLEIACGHGRIANRLAERRCRVTGVDVTPMYLELAREDAARRA